MERKEPSLLVRSGALVILCRFSKGIHRWPVSWQLYKCDITSRGILRESSYLRYCRPTSATRSTDSNQDTKREEKQTLHLCEGRQNNLFTPECVRCLEFFPCIVIVCYLNHQMDMKRSFHVLLSPEGVWTIWLCLNPVTKAFVILFLPGCVWFELTSKPKNLKLKSFFFVLISNLCLGYRQPRVSPLQVSANEVCWFHIVLQHWLCLKCGTLHR